MTSITFNSATTVIYDDAFTIPATAKIIGYAGSTAQAYATKYSRTFELISGILDSIAITTPASKLNYFAGNTLDLTDLAV